MCATGGQVLRALNSKRASISLTVCAASLVLANQALASTLITGAAVYDGTGSPAQSVAVRIDKVVIVSVGALRPRKGETVIEGQRFPIVGRVTMNTLMVDVAGWQDRVRLDDEVVLFGAQGDQRITQPEFETNGSAYAPEMLAVLGATPAARVEARCGVLMSGRAAGGVGAWQSPMK